MNHKSAEVVKVALVSMRNERKRALEHLDFSIEMKEQAVQRARSAGAKTRVTNELAVLKAERIQREQDCKETLQAILDFDAIVASMNEKGGQS